MNQKPLNSSYQKEGISLIIAFMGSLFVLTVVTFALISLSRSFQDSAKMERHSRAFYAVESGIEAALYHHNARGAGVSFLTENNHQKIEVSNITAQWTIAGRSDHITGLLKEGQTVSIPLFQDSSVDPTEEKDIDDIDPDNFDLIFYNDLEAPQFSELKKQYGDIDVASFLTHTPQQVLFDWSLEGIREAFDFDHDDNAVTPNISVPAGTFAVVPYTSEKEDSCGGTTSFICVNSFSSSGISLTTDSGTHAFQPGYHRTDRLTSNQTLKAQVSDPTFTNKTFSFRPMINFSNGSDRIPGIPYSVQFTDIGGNAISVPTPTYTIQVDTNSEEFGQSVILKIPERTKNSSFDYQIFD